MADEDKNEDDELILGVFRKQLASMLEGQPAGLHRERVVALAAARASVAATSNPGKFRARCMESVARLTLAGEIKVDENHLLVLTRKDGVSRTLRDLIQKPVSGGQRSAATVRHSPSTEGLDSEQLKVLQLVSDGHNVFFTGPAGSGKSHLLRIMIESESNKRPINSVHVCASTGIAACNIAGTTIHSWAGVASLCEVDELIRSIANNAGALRRWRRCTLLVVDEISMLDSRLFEALEKCGRLLRQRDAPFGGIQFVACGDFFQLPPVGISTSGLATAEQAGFCFTSEAWGRLMTHSVVLEGSYRQKGDNLLIGVLNEMRLGKLSKASIDLIESNQSTFSTETKEILPTSLVSRNHEVDRINAQCFAGLIRRTRAEIHSYVAKDWVPKNDLDSKSINFNQHFASVPSTLNLAVGAQVVLLKNLNEDGLANGSRGVVVGFERIKSTSGFNKWASNDFYAQLDEGEMCPLVKFADRALPRLVPRCEWEAMEGGSKVAARAMLPLKLAWALSIHKSQGMTLDHLIVDMSGIFECGQAYVALSRAKSLQGLRVQGLRVDRVFAHPLVLQFNSDLKNTHDSQHKPSKRGKGSEEDDIPWISLKRFRS